MKTPTPILDQIAETRADLLGIMSWLEKNLGTTQVLEIPTDCTLAEVKARTAGIHTSLIMINGHQFIGFSELNTLDMAFYYNPERQVYWVRESSISLIDSDAVLNYLLREF